MKFNRLFMFALLATLTFVLSACGAPPATNWPGMSTDGKLIYLADGRHVYSVKAETGAEATTTIETQITPLRFPLQADNKMSFYAVPALAPDGTLVVGNAASGYHELYAIDAATSNVKWSYVDARKPWLGGALILNESVFAPAGDGKLYAFSLSGQKLWDLALSEHALWTSPITDGVNLFVATLNHDLYCISPESGQIIWQVELDNGIIGHPAFVDGVLYLGTLSGNIYALNSSDGSQVWVQRLEGNIWGTPGVAPESRTLYIGTVSGTAGKFYALNMENGQVIWSRDDEGSIIAGPLVLADQVVYVTEQGRVQSLDLSGAPKWQDNFDRNKIYTTPLQVNDLIVVAPMGSQFLMVAYDVNGAKKWTFTPTK